MRADEAALAAFAADPRSRQITWRDGLPELADDGRLIWEPVGSPELFLGLDGGAPRFTAIHEVAGDFRAVLPLITSLSVEDAPIFAAAMSLARWHSRHRFCANCGHLSEIVRGGWSRKCPACGAEHYPRVDPVVIMLAEHDGRLLLGRQPHYPPGRYSALAGFVEVGENLEAAVARELHEEAGIQARNVRYIASQPWPFPSSLMFGCHADAASDALTIDTTELEDARWFSREEITAAMGGAPNAPFEAPPKAAIARTLLEHWLGA